MTIAIDWDIKHQFKQTNKSARQPERTQFGLIMSPPFRVGRHIVFSPASVCLSVTNRVRSITWKPRKLYSRNFIEISISMRWRAEWKNGNSAFYIFLSYFPLNFVHHKNRVRSITWKPLKLYSGNCIQISISMRWRAECKNGNSAFYFFLSYFPWNFVHHKNRVCSISWKPLKLYSRNFIHVSTNMPQCAECKNSNSVIYTLWVISLATLSITKNNYLWLYDCAIVNYIDRYLY